MNVREIADVCMLVAERLGVDDRNRAEFVMEILRRVLFGDSPLPDLQDVPTVATVPDSKKNVKKRVEKMKEAAKTHDTKQVLCRAGTKCHCSVCGQIYKVAQDIVDGLTSTEFASRIVPEGHDKPFPAAFRLRAVDNCIMTDCPVCTGDMTLVLWGRRPDKDFDDGTVRSTGGLI